MTILTLLVFVAILAFVAVSLWRRVRCPCCGHYCACDRTTASWRTYTEEMECACGYHAVRTVVGGTDTGWVSLTHPDIGVHARP